MHQVSVSFHTATEQAQVHDLESLAAYIKGEPEFTPEQIERARQLIAADKNGNGAYMGDIANEFGFSYEKTSRLVDEVETTEAEQTEATPTNPTLANVISTLYNKGKEVAENLYKRTFFDVAKTPDFMKQYGLTGDKFTVRYGVLSRHFGKDGSHDLTEKEWAQLPEALQHPFAISKLEGKEGGYRLYTSLKTEKGEYVVVGVDVKNAGRDLEVNAISTIFGRRNNANLSQNETIVYRSETITPEQSALLEQPNSAQYPNEREFSDDKSTKQNEKEEEPSPNNQYNRGEVYRLADGTEITIEDIIDRNTRRISWIKNVSGEKEYGGITTAELSKAKATLVSDKPSVQSTDSLGNPLNADGTLKTEKLTAIDQLTNEDFTHPSRNVELPQIPTNVDAAIGAEGKLVVIKKNLFERNNSKHSDLTPEQNREILNAALYNADLYGQNQPTKRPYNWVVINTKDEQGKNRLVLLEINHKKDNVEVVHWHYLDERGLEKIKRQAEREDEQLLILPSKQSKRPVPFPTVRTTCLLTAKVRKNTQTIMLVNAST